MSISDYRYSLIARVSVLAAAAVIIAGLMIGSFAFYVISPQPPIVVDNQDIFRLIAAQNSDMSAFFTDIEMDLSRLTEEQKELLRSYNAAYSQLNVLASAFIGWAEEQGLIIREDSDV